MKIIIRVKSDEIPLNIPARTPIIKLIVMLREEHPDTFRNMFTLSTHKGGKSLKTISTISDAILGDDPPSFNNHNETILYVKFKQGNKCSIM